MGEEKVWLVTVNGAPAHAGYTLGGLPFVYHEYENAKRYTKGEAKEEVAKFAAIGLRAEMVKPPD